MSHARRTRESQTLNRFDIAAAAIRIGTSGWSYPAGREPGTASSTRRAARAASGPATSCAFYAEHFDTVEVNSTFYRPPRRGHRAPLGGADAGRVRVLGQAVPEVHAPGMIGRGRRLRPPPTGAGGDVADSLRPTPADVDEFRAGIDPLAAAGKLGALLVQFPPGFQRRAGVARLPRRPAPRLRGTTRSRSSCATAAGATPARDTLALLERVRRRLGPDRRAEVPLLDPPELRCRTCTGCYYLRLHGRNAAQWWRHDVARRSLQLPVLAGGAEARSPTPLSAASAGVRKVYLYLEQPLRREVGGQRDDAQAPAR